MHNYLDPAVASQLTRLDLRARLVVEGFITGLHKSPYHGFSVEFAEYRQYIPGDAIRYIDWKVFGKTDRFYIKTFEEETNLKAYLLMDGSASMKYAANPQKVSKFEYAITLAAALSFLLLHQQDATGLALFGDKIHNFIPARAKSSHLHLLLEYLANFEPSGSTNIANNLHTFAERIKQRGLIILISDLYDDLDAVLTALKHFRHKKHEIIVFHLMDESELKLNFDKETIFEDAETGQKLQMEPWTIQQDYQELIKKALNEFRMNCLQHRIDYHLINTQTPYNIALSQYLIKRSKMG